MRYLDLGVRCVLMLVVLATPVLGLAGTSGPFTVTFSDLAVGTSDNPVHTPFSFPKFDASLGHLQSVDIVFRFSGTVMGSATGVGISSAVTHHVFFDLLDVTDNVFIGEPSIDVVSAPSPTIQFGPVPGSSNLAFSVGPGDLRYEDWRNGPGDVTGRLSVFFTNTAFDFLGLHFYPGDETGVYAGSFSVTYQYGPPLPVYACTGFGPPFDGPITVKTKVNRAIPVKMELFSNGTAITDGTIGGAAPVVNVSFSAGGGPATDVTGELLPLGQSDIGNQFRFDGHRWMYNLGTKSFTAAGTYTVTAMPGDAAYLISPTCTGEFVRQ